MNLRRFLTVNLLLLAISSFANDSSLNNGAHGPEPLNVAKGEESSIELLEENLHFTFRGGVTDVIVSFRLRNPSPSKTITELIGFPDIGLSHKKDPDAWMSIGVVSGPIQNMQTHVNGKPVASALQFGRVKIDKSGVWSPADDEESFTMAWHVIKHTFPPLSEVILERRYTVPHGIFPYWYDVFYYTTQTGAGWKGSIGKLTATVQLEDGLTVDDLRWRGARGIGYDISVHPDRTDWKVVSPRKMILEWHDFDPASAKDKQLIRVVASQPNRPDLSDAVGFLYAILFQAFLGAIPLTISLILLGILLRKRGTNALRIFIVLLIFASLAMAMAIALWSILPHYQRTQFWLINLPMTAACVVLLLASTVLARLRLRG